MSITLNLQGDCMTSAKGTGLGDCVAQYGDLQGIDIYNKGFSLDLVTGTLPTEAEYRDFVQGETLYPLNDLFNFEQLTPDNELATGSTGKMSEIRAGKPQYSITWDKGGCWHQGLYDKRGQNRWDIAFKFETGVLFATDVNETVLKAFDNGMFSVATFKFLQGTDPEMSTVIFQLNTALEMNSQKAFFTWDSLGFNMNLVDGIINASVSFATTPVAGTEYNLFVKDECNESVTILGLDDPNEWAIEGVQASPTTISGVTFNIGTGAYDIIVTPTTIVTDTISFRLVDVAKSFDAAENASGDFYKGVSSLVTL